MSYTVFARKFRPKKFEDVIGQSHITTTLKNAISQGRVAHAYIFTGPRGVGKTTTARIFARALECEKGPKVEPCGTCSMCDEITRSVSLDVLEIDGASNRGIDEIRNLRESIKFAPAKARYKIYIIDEVHMLTQEAFNALLKVLEEPPPHAKFIFATTNPHKVPPTILSRCQRFDFRRIPSKDILDNLRDIVKSEKLKAEDEALAVIARSADGSLRDGQVILDQMISFTGGNMNKDDVLNVLGLIDEDVMFDLAESIAAKDPAAALDVLHRVMEEGKDAFQLAAALIGHFRNMLIAKVGKNPAVHLGMELDELKRYEAQAGKFSREDALYAIYALTNTIDLMRKSSLAIAPLEATIVKLASSSGVIPIDEILKRIETLEKRSGTGQGQPSDRKIDAKPLGAPKSNQASGVAAQPQAASSEPAHSLDDVVASWNSIINFIKGRKISIASYLQEGYPVRIDSKSLVVGFPKEFQFHKEVLESNDNRRLIEEGVKTAMGLELKVQLEIVESPEAKRPSVNSYGDEDNVDVPDQEQSGPDGSGQGREDDPIIKEAMEMFGGAIAARGSAKRKQS